MDDLRDVWVLGFRDTDEPPEKGLARVFGVDRARARRLIATMPTVVKREVTAEEAEPIVKALEKIGARVALVPSGASKPPPPRPTLPPVRWPSSPSLPSASAPTSPSLLPGLSSSTTAESSEAGGLARHSIESLGLDIGRPPEMGAPSASMPPIRRKRPSDHDALLSESIPSPARHSAPPNSYLPSLDGPDVEDERRSAPPIAYLPAVTLPPRPEMRPEQRLAAPLLVGSVVAVAGAAALAVASAMEGSVFGPETSLAGAAAAGGAMAVLLLGLQLLVAAAFQQGVRLWPALVATALVVAAAVSGGAYAMKQVDPVELARRERDTVLNGIRGGLLPEARSFLGRAQSHRIGDLALAESTAFVASLYAAGARQVYAVVDFDQTPERAHMVAVQLPITQARRNALQAAVRRRFASAPAMGSGDWWLVPTDS